MARVFLQRIVEAEEMARIESSASESEEVTVYFILIFLAFSCFF